MPANTVNVTTAAQLQAALLNAASQPISCINITDNLIAIASTLVLPKTLATISKTLVINGNGATIQPSPAGGLPVLMQRLPLNQAPEANNMLSYRFIIRDLYFNGKVGSGVGLELGASMGSVIENCTFKSLSIAVDLKNCPMTSIRNCIATSIGGIAYSIGYGNWAGATTNNSQSSNTKIEMSFAETSPGAPGSCNNGLSCFAIYASNNVMLDHCTVGGGNPNYHVLFDSIGSSIVNSFHINNMEFKTPASIAGVKLKLANGFAKLDGLYSNVDMTLVSAESVAGFPHLYVENVPWVSNGTRFETLGANVVWSFNEVYDGEMIFSTTKWVGSVVPFYRYSEAFIESKQIVTNLMKVNNKTISQ